MLVNAELLRTESGPARGQNVDVNDFFIGFDAANTIVISSLTQMHVATKIGTGITVVLKLQHPGVRRMRLQTLVALSTLLRILAGGNPKYDMRPVMNAWIALVRLETDFFH